MHRTNQITVVLKAREGESIADLAPFLKSGCTVLVGRSGAVVSAVSAGDKITHAEQLENQVLLAESAMRRGIVLDDAPPTAEKTSVVAETPYAQVRVTNIDEWITTVQNARRYEWLRARPLTNEDEVWIQLAKNSSVAPDRWALGAGDPEGCDVAIDLAMRKEVESCAQ